VAMQAIPDVRVFRSRLHHCGHSFGSRGLLGRYASGQRGLMEQNGSV